MNVPASSSKDTTAQVLKLNEEHTEQKDRRKTVLPPECDENDSRWTLKYREPAPGLVELMEHSGVYVNVDKLAECEKWSNDCKAFARMLLTEIFTTTALSTCSWSSETTNDIHSGQASPVLNEHATDILQKYVTKYGQIRNWNKTDFQCILKGIRQIMLDMRHVRQKEVKKKAKRSKTLEDNGFQFVLPPEYDKNNSRWTLKYHEYAPGLVELIKDSCVFVQRIQLSKFKRSSKDSVTLARMLLNEIFTKSAMSTCSWNGPTSKNSDLTDSNGRPQLDNNAMVSLLRFVSEHELENGWILPSNRLPAHNKEEIGRSIRQKLKLLRRVAGKREEAENADKRRKKILTSLIINNRMDPPPENRSANCRTNKRQCPEPGPSRDTETPTLNDEQNDVSYGLPPEYDENDSQWTLKYREPAPELVELIDDSSVYVRADKLTECKEKSNDCWTLAGMLLTEVFSTTALRICKLSLTNNELYNIPSRGNDFEYLLTPEPTPELDAYAEIILLNFVDEYALEKGWTIFNFQLIRKSMVHKIHEIRRQYADKVKCMRIPYRKKHIVGQTGHKMFMCGHKPHH